MNLGKPSVSKKFLELSQHNPDASSALDLKANKHKYSPFLRHLDDSLLQVSVDMQRGVTPLATPIMALGGPSEELPLSGPSPVRVTIPGV